MLSHLMNERKIDHERLRHHPYLLSGHAGYRSTLHTDHLLSTLIKTDGKGDLYTYLKVFFDMIC